MNHELRTPMNAILGFAQLVQLDSNISPEVRDNIEEILVAGGNLMALIDNLLDLAYLESGAHITAIEVISLQKVITESLATVQQMAAERNIDLIDNCKDTPHRVLGNHRHLKQVLSNLLNNAVKYNRGNGRVTVHCIHKAPGFLDLQVTDTGQGIAEDRLEQIFQSFQRAQDKPSTIDGAGVGLCVSRYLMRAMGGELSLAGTSSNGSSFCMRMKLAGGQ
jgi:signal transduction histidine kinase